MTKDEINEEACEHCNHVMCSVCENRTCDNTHLATLKCREWRDRRAGYYCGAEPREKRIAELEKENAELWGKLTKAKDIIAKLVEGIRIISDPKICMTDVDTFVSKAEQFLKEVSE